MEDITNRNIFDDKDLCRLDPDYVPTDIFLRMQLRSSMVSVFYLFKYWIYATSFFMFDMTVFGVLCAYSLVMDTHRHARNTGIRRNSNLQRNFKVRDCPIVNKEIAKIRNNFHNMNTKNKILLKEAISFVENSNSKDLFKCNQQDEYKTLKDDTDPYLEELSRDLTNNLIICNDTEFKINEKPISEVSKIYAKANTERIRKNTKIAIKNDEDSVEEILRIECSFHNKEEYNDTKDTLLQSLTRDQKRPDEMLSSSNIDGDSGDLQSLLIMMAISPSSNECGENFENTDIHNQCRVYEHDSLKNDSLLSQNNKPVSPTAVNSENIAKIMSIKPLRPQMNQRQRQLLEKYVEKWKLYVKNKTDYQLRERQATLDNFFDKLAKKKTSHSPDHINRAKLAVKDFSTYQHRYKVQKHIIALQKAKLEEQNRIIEELKYNKIVEASRQSVDEMKEEVRKAYCDIDRQLKPKIKCLTNELKVHDIQETSLVLHCLRVPQFLQRMEKRAREREEKHAIIRERRKQMEEERIRIKQQAELAKAEMDKEEKIKRMKELKEKRKKEKIEGIRKKQHAERMRALNVMADLHYEKYLMAKYGIRPLRLLIAIRRDNIEKAKAHYLFQLKKNIFLHWMWHTEDMLFERNYIAEDNHRKKILKKVFDGFKKNHYEYVLKKQVAEDYYDFYVTNQAFKMFREGIQIARKENEVKWHKAEKYCNSNLLFKTFTCWRTLPALNALRREQEARKARWREKVLLVVPDYTPPDD